MTAKKCTKKRDVGTLKLLFCQSKPIVFCRYRWHRRRRCLSSVCFLSNTRSFSFVFWTERDVKTGIVICMLAALIKLVALVASTARDLSVIIAWSFQKIPNKSMSTASMVKTRAGVRAYSVSRLIDFMLYNPVKPLFGMIIVCWDWVLKACVYFFFLCPSNFIHELLERRFFELTHSHSIHLFCQVLSFWYHAQSPL